MKQTRLIMGMPVTVEIVDKNVHPDSIEKVFDYFQYVDGKFSTYKNTSEITKINLGEIKKKDWSPDMKKIFKLSAETKKQTNGYFNIEQAGFFDPSGIVKGWAILNAAELLKKMGYKNYYVEAGGDIQVSGKNNKNQYWRIGIRNPFNRYQNVKIVSLKNRGIATSGTYIRGQHVYNPYLPKQSITDVVSLTIIGPNVYEADRYATAAFAMGKNGIAFIGKIKGLEGYMIDNKGQATFTGGFNNYVVHKNENN